MIPALPTLLDYKNPQVVAHFCHKNPQYSLEEGQQLFTDLLQWMWLRQQRAKFQKKTYLFGPLIIIDELWHDFILHTQDYHSFCTQYFGSYFHHEVEPLGFEHHLDQNELNDFLQDCFTYLDADWVERRFSVCL